MRVANASNASGLTQNRGGGPYVTNPAPRHVVQNVSNIQQDNDISLLLGHAAPQQTVHGANGEMTDMENGPFSADLFAQNVVQGSDGNTKPAYIISLFADPTPQKLTEAAGDAPIDLNQQRSVPSKVAQGAQDVMKGVDRIVPYSDAVKNSALPHTASALQGVNTNPDIARTVSQQQEASRQVTQKRMEKATQRVGDVKQDVHQREQLRKQESEKQGLQNNMRLVARHGGHQNARMKIDQILQETQRNVQPKVRNDVTANDHTQEKLHKERHFLEHLKDNCEKLLNKRKEMLARKTSIQTQMKNAELTKQSVLNTQLSLEQGRISQEMDKINLRLQSLRKQYRQMANGLPSGVLQKQLSPQQSINAQQQPATQKNITRQQLAMQEQLAAQKKIAELQRTIDVQQRQLQANSLANALASPREATEHRHRNPTTLLMSPPSNIIPNNKAPRPEMKKMMIELFRHAARVIKYKLSGDARCESTLMHLNDYYRRCWPQWSAGGMESAVALQAISLIVRDRCPNVGNFEVVADYKSWLAANNTAKKEPVVLGNGAKLAAKPTGSRTVQRRFSAPALVRKRAQTAVLRIAPAAANQSAAMNLNVQRVPTVSQQNPSVGTHRSAPVATQQSARVATQQIAHAKSLQRAQDFTHQNIQATTRRSALGLVQSSKPPAGTRMLSSQLPNTVTHQASQHNSKISNISSRTTPMLVNKLISEGGKKTALSAKVTQKITRSPKKATSSAPRQTRSSKDDKCRVGSTKNKKTPIQRTKRKIPLVNKHDGVMTVFADINGIDIDEEQRKLFEENAAVGDSDYKIEDQLTSGALLGGAMLLSKINRIAKLHGLELGDDTRIVVALALQQRLLDVLEMIVDVKLQRKDAEREMWETVEESSLREKLDRMCNEEEKRLIDLEIERKKIRIETVKDEIIQEPKPRLPKRTRIAIEKQKAMEESQRSALSDVVEGFTKKKKKSIPNLLSLEESRRRSKKALKYEKERMVQSEQMERATITIRDCLHYASNEPNMRHSNLVYEWLSRAGRDEKKRTRKI